MKLNDFVFLTMFISSISSAGACITNEVDEIRAKIGDVLLSAENLDVETIGQTGRLRFSPVAYTNLAVAVSNRFCSIANCFPQCVTNQLEKYVLMSAGWCFDDDYFFRYFAMLVSVAERGDLTREDLRWYRCADLNEQRMNYLVLHHEDVAVSNVINVLQRITGETEYYERIKTGEAKRRLLLRLREFNIAKP